MLRSLAPRPILSATRPARPAGPAGPAPIRVAPMHAAPVSSSSRRSVATAAAQGASTVRVSVQGRHLEVTPSLKAYAVSFFVWGKEGERGGQKAAIGASLPCECAARGTHTCTAPARPSTSRTRSLKPERRHLERGGRQVGANTQEALLRGRARAVPLFFSFELSARLMGCCALLSFAPAARRPVALPHCQRTRVNRVGYV